uniref:Bm13409 n=1 Tax=Brugia malayi TaxID=6279 RepID=A0A0J9XR12_BRUMA|nr:Bm13409 [Brugia malayi]
MKGSVIPNFWTVIVDSTCIRVSGEVGFTLIYISTSLVFI